MINKAFIIGSLLLGLALFMPAQMPLEVQEVAPADVDPEALEEETILDVDVPLFTTFDDYNILSPRSHANFYYRIEEEDIFYPFQRRLVGEDLSMRTSLSEDDFEEMRVDVWNRTRRLQLDTQGQSFEIANIWYAYWRLFNAWEDYLQRYIIEAPLDNRSPVLPKYIANVPDDDEFDPETFGRQQMPGMGGMQPMGAPMGGAPMAGGPMGGMETTRTAPGRRGVPEPEIQLPPVTMQEALALIEELETSHRNQLDRIMRDENRMEQAYQGRIAFQRARIETYHNWKDEQTVDILHHLRDHTELVNFDFEE